MEMNMRRHLLKVGCVALGLILAYGMVVRVVGNPEFVNLAAVIVVLACGIPLAYAGLKIERGSAPRATTRSGIWTLSALRALIYMAAVAVLGAAMWLSGFLTPVYANMAVAFLPLCLLHSYWATRRQYEPVAAGVVGTLAYKGASPIGWKARLTIGAITAATALAAMSIESEWLASILS